VQGVCRRQTGDNPATLAQRSGIVSFEKRTMAAFGIEGGVNKSLAVKKIATMKKAWRQNARFTLDLQVSELAE